MNRKNLIVLMAVVTATAALGGCASAPALPHANGPQQASAAEPGITGSAWEVCVRAAIPQLDDPQSASTVIARAAMKGCAAQYTGMEQAMVSTLAPTCSQAPTCTRAALAKVQREATQIATEDVVTARVRVAGEQVLKCQ